MAQASTQDVGSKAPKTFEWLRRGARGPAYVSYAAISDRHACGFEFGADGFAGCCNYGGELLQMAAPSNERGIVIARGDYSGFQPLREIGGSSAFGPSDSLYATIARAQGEVGGFSTFGLKLSSDKVSHHCLDGAMSKDGGGKNGSSFRLGEIRDRGSFNYRWPLVEYSLLTTGTDPEQQPVEVGTCVMLSFVKGGVLYQVMRFEQERRSSQSADSFHPIISTDSKIVLSIGGPVRLGTFGVDHNTLFNNFHMAKLVDNGQRAVVVSADIEDDLSSDSRAEIHLEGAVYRVDGDDGRQSETPLKLQLSPRQDATAGITAETPADSQTSTTQGAVPGVEPAESKPWHEESMKPFYVNCLVLSGGHDRRPDSLKATFVAAFRLTDRVHGSDPQDWDSLPAANEIYHYVNGLSWPDTSKSSSGPLGAPSPMWEAIFLNHETWRAPLPKASLSLSDVTMVGRCLEKTLGVGAVPLSAPHQRDATSAEVKGLVLVSNLFLQPTVDLRSLFWKVRFLAKVHQFLKSTIQTLPSPDNGESCVGQEMHLQILRLESSIRELVQYLVQRLLKQRPQEKPEETLSSASTTSSFKSLMPDEISMGESSYYYVIVTVWYAVNAFKDLGWNFVGLASYEETELYVRLPPDDLNFGESSREEVALLQWYHYASLLNLIRMYPGLWHTKDTDLEGKVRRLRCAAVIQSAAKFASKAPYLADDEICDRLAFLATELGLCSLVSSHSVRRIKDRDYTRGINPGKAPGNDSSIRTSGPWEVHVLSHHSWLKMLSLEADSASTEDERAHWRDKVERHKEKIYLFLNAEGTLVHSWERDEYKARNCLLRSETTAIVASTLLDLQMIPMPKYDEEAMHRDGANRTGSSSTSSSSATLPEQRAVAHAVRKRASMGSEGSPPIPWARLGPPRIYHPPDFLHSLDDTPELFTSRSLRKVSQALPAALAGYVGKDPEDFTPETLLSVPDLHFLSIHDVKADATTESAPPLQVKQLVNNYKKAMKNDKQGAEDAIQQESPENNDKQGAEHAIQPNSGVESRRTAWRNFLKDQRKGLSLKLYDSLVDQEVRHRFLMVGSYSPRLLKLLLYVSHPRSATCLNSHILKFSSFASLNANPWMARITLQSWQDRQFGTWDDEEISTESDDPQGKAGPGLEHPYEPGLDGDKDVIKFPDYLVRSGIPDFNIKRRRKYWRKASSFVLTTDAFGDFSKCTIFSDLIDDEEMQILAKDCRDLWQTFVHQPQTARCLVFFLVLGKLCQKIAEGCNEATDHFDDKITLGDCSYTDGRINVTGHVKLKFALWVKLKFALWSLESLKRIEASLKESLTSIVEAKSELRAQIREGPGKRSEALEQMCEHYLLKFDTNLGQLTSAHARLGRQIELSGWYKDSFSAMLSLSQNDQAIDQNRTIQKLTYLTIGYLPLSFVAALLAIPGDWEVSFMPKGNSWFVGSIAILFLITIVVAASIGRIVDFFKKPILDPLKVSEFKERIRNFYAGRSEEIRKGKKGKTLRRFQQGVAQRLQPSRLSAEKAALWVGRGLAESLVKGWVVFVDILKLLFCCLRVQEPPDNSLP